MYFPYLRGRQFELLALRELVENDIIGDKIIPVLEPIKPTATLLKTLNLFSEKEHKIAFIYNPEVGNFESDLSMLRENNMPLYQSITDKLSNNDMIVKSYLVNKDIHEKVKKEEISNCMLINRTHDELDIFMEITDGLEPEYSLIPDDRAFIRKTHNSRVIFKDRFEKEQRNSDYANKVDNFFSEDHIYYEEDGFKGFSDYSVVGQDFMESGFAPLAVAIHIVYFNENNELRIHHFVSESNDDIKDPAGKFGEAVSKLHKWINEMNVPMTKGLYELDKCYKNGKYPGLGTIKKLSIMHHLELINMYLEGDL